MGAWPHADRHPALGARGRRRPRPAPGGARGGRGLHLRGPPRRVHPAGPGGRGHHPARAGHQRGHRLPPQPGPAGPPGLRPAAADAAGGSPSASGPRSGPRWRSATAPSFDRPIARMRELVAALRAIFATWETGERLDFRGEFSSHTLMPPMFNPGPLPFGMPPIAIGGLGPQMVRLAAEVADGLLVMPFNTARPLRPAHAPGHRRGPGPGGPEAVGAHGDRRGHRVLRAGRGGAGGGPHGRPLAALLLRLHPGLPAGPGGGGLGGPPARAQSAVQVGPVGGDARRDRRHHARCPGRGGVAGRGGRRTSWPGSAGGSTGWASTLRT